MKLAAACLLGLVGLALAADSADSSGDSSAASGEKALGKPKKVVTGNLCTSMQLCIDKKVRKSWGRMYDQLKNFKDSKQECSVETRDLHSKVGKVVGVSRLVFLGIVEKVHDDMLPRMQHVDEVVEACMEQKNHKDGVDYCADWRAPAKGQKRFSTTVTCDKLDGADFQLTMDECMEENSNLFDLDVDAESEDDDEETKAQKKVFLDLRACQDTDIQEISHKAADKAHPAALEASRKKRAAMVGNTVNQEEAKQGVEELMTTIKLAKLYAQGDKATRAMLDGSDDEPL